MSNAFFCCHFDNLTVCHALSKIPQTARYPVDYRRHKTSHAAAMHGARVIILILRGDVTEREKNQPLLDCYLCSSDTYHEDQSTSLFNPKARCNRTQHCWPTTPNMVECNMLRPFAQPVVC